MFKKLKNKIIIITMAITTVVLILSGTIIMIFTSAARPEPKPFLDPALVSEFERNDQRPNSFDDQDIREYVYNDRKEGNMRLLITLIFVGAVIELATFFIVRYSSKKIVEPVKDSYEKQKQFITNASHELKTPLAIIEANVEALDVDKANEKWKTNIENETTHANKLVLDLLELARMDAGSSGKSKAEEFDLKKSLEGRIETFAPKFSGKISLKSSDSLEKYLLQKADFLQVVDILLDNATKYGDKKISVVLEKNQLTIKNDGTVVKKSDQEKIFDRFYQADKTKEGSGLGLSIAKAICDKNGWKIKCESEKSLTKFTIDFSHA